MKTYLLLAVAFSLTAVANGEEFVLHRFERSQLTDVYYSEGANIGDVDGDGAVDVVHGPYWFAGPKFDKKHEIYAAKAQPRERYADSFFSWVHDFNADGLPDVLAVGFPGTPAFVYENPGKEGYDKHWKKHETFDWVSNESPHFTNLVGDDRPELVCTRDGFFGYAVIDEKKPFEPWKFHAVSEKVAPGRFGHGLGVGDVDGDGRLDMLTKDGWLQQPASLEGDPLWKYHKVAFAPRGGADMFAYDVDGDGDNDVITSLAAHEFGLAWHEQIKGEAGEIGFRQHTIMGATPEENRYGVVFSELHSVNLADIDGDGLKDIVTGKTYWSHHTQSPQWDAGAVVYWFKLSRTKEGVRWLPFKADGESGIGRQIIVGDLNGDKLPDMIAGGMKGCHVLLHKREVVSEQEWKDAQPKPRPEMASGLSPEEAAANMTVPEGFRVSLAAGEPRIHQPIAFTFDHRGRLWVAEAHTYPIRAPEGEGKDKIIILEDTNGDGSLDSRKVFAEGLNLVSGLEVGFGGAWVGAAPYLMFLPDADGDDRADGEPKILLDGFGYQDTHETLNAFNWGPDGWLYGCHGVFTHSRVGKPGTPDEKRTPMNAAVWRYHPTRHQFEVFAHGTSNPWGVDFNDHGEAFCTACVIPHLFHVIQGGRFQRQAGQHFNPHTYEDIKTIADHLHYEGSIRDHAWWGKEPHAPADTLAAGGGHAHAGAMIYLGDNWPADYRGRIFMCNIHGNRVNSDILEPHGSGFIGRHGKDLLLANDHWFRGINLRTGPDGSVYLIDWYDKNACHRRTPEIWDRTNGRIYNIAYGRPERKVEDLSKMSDAELVALHLHENEWQVRTARRLLQERAAMAKGEFQKDKQSANFLALWDIINNEENVAHRLRAIWTLHAIGELPPAHLRNLMRIDSEFIRAWAIQLDLEDRVVEPTTLELLVKLAKGEKSPVVRRYLASALQRMPLNARWEIAAELLAHGEDAEDHNLPLMIWYAVEPLVKEDAARAIGLAEAAQLEQVSRYIFRRAAAEEQSLDAVTARLAATDNAQAQQLILDEMLLAFEGRVGIAAPPSWTKAYDAMTSSKNAAVREQADRVAVALGDRRIFPRMRAVLTNTKAEIDARKKALDILVRGRDAEAADALLAAVGEPALRGAAIRALSAHDDEKTPGVLLSIYAKLPAEEKRDCIATLVSRPKYALALLEAVDAERLPRTDVHAYHIRQLLRFENAELRKRIEGTWGAVRETPAEKQKQIAALKELLTPARLKAADTSNGRRLFAKTCAGCHKLFGDGESIGPDITGANRASLDYLLENIIDPSAVLGKDYRMSIFALVDGRVISGLVMKETDSAFTVRTINDTVVIAKTDVEQQRLSDTSLMPDRQLETLKPNDIRDLFAYLGGTSQVPLRGPRSPIDVKTGRVPGAIEGEAMKVVSVTAGAARPQPMGNFKQDRWSGASQLWWTGGKPGARLMLELPVEREGKHDVEIVLTRARDYAIVQPYLNDAKLGGPIDLYNSPDVITTGVLTFENLDLSAGTHQLSFEITGAHPDAAKAFMLGLDYVRLAPK